MKKLMKMIHFCLLVTNGDFDSVDFLIQKKLFNNRVEYEIEEETSNKLVPMSNAGNVQINLKCYLVDKNINNIFPNHSFRVISENLSFDEYKTHTNIEIAFEKRLAIQSTINNNSELNNAKNFKTILNVEVIPNGRKYEIPVKIEIKEVEPVYHNKFAYWLQNHLFSSE